MDYKKLIDDLNQIAEMDFISCPDNAEAAIKAATAITDLLARAEAAEAAQETLQRAMSEYKAREERAEERANRWEEEVKAYSESDLAKAHDLLSADWAKQKMRADAAEARAEKVERERDAAEEDISDIFVKIDDVRERVGIDNADADGELAELCTGYCLHAGPMCYKRGESCKCDNFKWRGQKEE